MNRQEYKNIAIIKLSALGDIVHTIPAFYSLRKHSPNAKITWFAEPGGAKLLEIFDGIDEIVTLDLKSGGLFNKIKNLRAVLSIYKYRFDLVLDFQGLWKSAIFAWLLKGYAVGFGKNNLREPQARFFYKRKARHFDETGHVIFKNIHLAREIVPGVESAVSYPLKPLAGSVKLQAFLDARGLEPDHYVIVNVGGGWETKVMAEGQFIAIIDGIKRKYKTVLLWGNEKEKAKAEFISLQTGVPVTEHFNFPDLVAFIRGCRLIVTADTLAMHLADVVDKPSVGVFGPTSPWRNGSLVKTSVSITEKSPCGFCYKKKCDTIDCIKNINVEHIVDAVDKVYET